MVSYKIAPHYLIEITIPDRPYTFLCLFEGTDINAACRAAVTLHAGSRVLEVTRPDPRTLKRLALLDLRPINWEPDPSGKTSILSEEL